MNTYQIEYTDTFAGESNYSWVRRYTIQAKNDRAAIRAAKAAVGLTGMRCIKSDYGDCIDLRPVGCCTVLFITQGESA
jgi:hypothetical protein